MILGHLNSSPGMVRTSPLYTQITSVPDCLAKVTCPGETAASLRQLRAEFNPMWTVSFQVIISVTQWLRS